MAERLDVSAADSLVVELGCLTTALRLMTEDSDGLDADGKASDDFPSCQTEERVKALGALLRRPMR